MWGNMRKIKTTIWVPEDVRNEGRRLAKRLGISFSELVSRAMADFLRRIKNNPKLAATILPKR